MQSLRHSRFTVLALMCVALLGARVGGAHLHLCLDGSEPPAALHIEGGEHHDDHHLSGTHDDVDVPLLAEALTKAGKTGFDLPALLLTVWLTFLFLRRTVQPRVPLPFRLTAFSDFLRPPLRGPPLLISR